MWRIIFGGRLKKETLVFGLIIRQNKVPCIMLRWISKEKRIVKNFIIDGIWNTKKLLGFILEEKVEHIKEIVSQRKTVVETEKPLVIGN